MLITLQQHRYGHFNDIQLLQVEEGYIVEHAHVSIEPLIDRRSAETPLHMKAFVSTGTRNPSIESLRVDIPAIKPHFNFVICTCYEDFIFICECVYNHWILYVSVSRALLI